MEISKTQIIAIDPSYRDLGWATMKDGKELSGHIEPIGDTPAERLNNLCVELKRVILAPDMPFPHKLVVELPGAFSYARSQSKWTGKSLNQSSLQKLNLAIGTIFGVAQGMSIEVEFVDVTWKGKMNKGIAQSITGKKNHNEADAVLLLRWYLSTKKNFK